MNGTRHSRYLGRGWKEPEALVASGSGGYCVDVLAIRRILKSSLEGIRA